MPLTKTMLTIEGGTSGRRSVRRLSSHDVPHITFRPVEKDRENRAFSRAAGRRADWLNKNVFRGEISQAFGDNVAGLRQTESMQNGINLVCTEPDHPSPTLN